MSRFLPFVILIVFTSVCPPDYLTAAKEEAVFACPVSIDPVGEKYRCINGNQLTLRLPYLGVASGVTTSLVGPGSPTVGGDDPATVADGIIQLIDLAPAATYVLTIAGPSCMGPDAVTYNFITPNYTCGNDLTVLINEVLPEPGSDTNGDGVNNFQEEQFVEIFNPDPLVEIDLDAWGLRIGLGVRFIFPTESILGPRQAVVVFGGGILTDPCHYKGFGFLNINSNGDAISLRTPTGSTVHSMTFSGTAVPPNVSLALDPDGITSGGFVPHISIVTNPVNYSPCFSNHLPGVVLPVSLTDFSADYHKGVVNLKWSTSHEEDHHYFEVERSPDGQIWEAIKTVWEPALQNEMSGEDRHYQTDDLTPFMGTTYYRLRQVDIDGTATIYGPRSVNVTTRNEEVVLFPNPAKEQLWVARAAEAVAFEIIDSYGRQLRRGTLASAQINPITIATLPAGVYYLRLLDGTTDQSLYRWVKQ